MFVKYQFVSRSPLTPLNKGGTGVEVPLDKRDLGGSLDFEYMTNDF
jgi:hypothetical protein